MCISASLEAERLFDQLIKQFDLQNLYNNKRLGDSEKDVNPRSFFVAGKDGLITISVEDHDPNRAAQIAERLSQVRCANKMGGWHCRNRRKGDSSLKSNLSAKKMLWPMQRLT